LCFEQLSGFFFAKQERDSPPAAADKAEASSKKQDSLSFQKQSHQVIENIRRRPEIGQNNPNLGIIQFWT
jgi:hypothetical protein